MLNIAVMLAATLSFDMSHVEKHLLQVCMHIVTTSLLDVFTLSLRPYISCGVFVFKMLSVSLFYEILVCVYHNIYIYIYCICDILYITVH